MTMWRAVWRSRDAGDSCRTSHLGSIAVRLLWALLLTSVCAEDRSFRGVTEHVVKQWPGVPPAVPGVPPPVPVGAKGTCVKDSSRTCRSFRQSGTVVDHITQCHAGSLDLNSGVADAQHTTNQASCSADAVGSVAGSGTCICGEGFCADTDMLCHRGTYQVINEVFSIISKAYPEEKLYMTPDGKVKVGYPPDPRAAQWRISVTGQGVKLLWTELYTNTIMQEYESCSTMTDMYGVSFTKCVRQVGHVQDVRADEMGWFIELHGDLGAQKHIGPNLEEFVQLRSANTWDMLYISASTKEGLACEARGRKCPGDSGAFRFDPPLLQRLDFNIDSAPGTLPGNLSAYFVTACMAGILICCLNCAFRTAGIHTPMRNLLLIPCFEMARALGYRGAGAKI